MNATLPYWLALWRTPGVGPATFRMLQQQFESLAELFLLSRSDLRELKLSEESATALLNPAWNDVERDLKWAMQAQHTIITWHDERYPERLKHIASSPPLLFVRGAPELLNWPQLGMVGSRNPSALGLETATQFAHHLASLGLGITSGLALGIDAASHRGALNAQGPTIAVMGTGPDHIYPARHHSLAEQIAEQGALVTEFPVKTVTRPENFPRRNRLISGLSLGILVIEAAIGSGSLITARYANEQNREVFAIPGSIHHPLAQGCHALIQQGAKLVTHIDDILVELQPSFFSSPLSRLPKEASLSLNTPKTPLSDELAALLAAVDFAPTPIERLMQRSGLTIEQVSSMLSVLELRAFITAVPGGYARAGGF